MMETLEKQIKNNNKKEGFWPVCVCNITILLQDTSSSQSWSLFVWWIQVSFIEFIKDNSPGLFPHLDYWKGTPTL